MLRYAMLRCAILAGTQKNIKCTDWPQKHGQPRCSIIACAEETRVNV